MADTTYIVLRNLDGDPGKPWAFVANEEAANAHAAVRDAVQSVVDGGGEAAGVYVAVPARSWKPVTVEAVQTTVLRLS